MGRMGRLGGLRRLGRLRGLRGLRRLGASVNLRSSFGDGKGKVYLTYSELKADLLICEFGNLLIILTFVANSYFTIKKWFYPLKFLGLCNTS